MGGSPHTGCSFAAILDALRGRGLLPGGGTFTPLDTATQARRRAKERAEAAKRAAQARRLWQETHPVAGTLAESYLRARGIICAPPETLRFAPECWHPTARRIPALVALLELALLHIRRCRTSSLCSTRASPALANKHSTYYHLEELRGIIRAAHDRVRDEDLLRPVVGHDVKVNSKND